MVTHVDQISTPPTPADPPAVFEERAAQVWSDLARNVLQMNQQADEIEAIGQAADAAKLAAQADSDAAMGFRNEANAANTSAQSAAASAGAGKDGAEDARQTAEAAADRALAAAADAENRVPMTSTAGAAILPEGDTAERPEPLPAAGWLLRFNKTLGLGELYDRAAGVWDQFVSRRWFAEMIGEAIIYPNGGSAASPSSVSVNSRYVMGNPFPGRNVICVAEVLLNGVWGETGWYTYDTGVGSAYGAFGVKAAQLADEIVIKTALRGLLSENAGSPHTSIPVSGVTTPLPCRVKVWKVKGAA